MTTLIIILLTLSHLGVGILWRNILLRTSNGYPYGLTSAVVCVTLWPLLGAAELNEWIREKIS